ncbi:hypothetical protein V3390_03370 [Luteimonas sp. FXH3W]|uniref:Glycosyltransferase 99 N-terminal domain-containing protein n=1 Tax=Aquilutibacter rugosus TaxID=3115820 RepID=A0ABU7V0C9_9GAMM
MYISFLLPFVDRGSGPLHQWVMLAQMAAWSPDEVAFIGDQRYFDEKGIPFNEQLEVSGIVFTVPSKERFRAYRKISLSPSDRIEPELLDNGIEFFRRLITESLTDVRDQLLDATRQILGKRSKPKAYLTWCNCPSLTELGKILDVPVIHNELGPLRSPQYANTIYFDFDGVNGNTEPSKWGSKADLESALQGASLVGVAKIRQLILEKDPVLSKSASFEVGIALQVDDDSNLVAFSRGWSTIGLIHRANQDAKSRQVLVRQHPSAPFAYRGTLGAIDHSRSSLEFIAKCKTIYSINSSVLVECLLWGKPFYGLGDSSVSVFSTGSRLAPSSAKDLKLALNAYVLSYLVPSSLLFDPSYYSWRLEKKRTLAELHRRHLDAYESLALSTSKLKGHEVSALPRPTGRSVKRDPEDRSFLQASLVEEKFRNLQSLIDNLGLENSELKKYLSDRKSAAEWLESQLDAFRTESASDKRAIESLRSSLAERNSSLEWHAQQLKNHQKELENSKAIISERNSSLEWHAQQLKNHQKELEKSKAIISERNSSLEWHAQQLKNHQKELENSKAIISERNSSLEWHAQQLKNHQKELDSSKAVISSLQTDIEAKKGVILSLQIRADNGEKELAALDFKLAQLTKQREQDIVARDEILAEKRALCADLEAVRARAESLTEGLGERTAAVEWLESQLENYRSELGNANESISLLKANLEERQEAIELLDSRLQGFKAELERATLTTSSMAEQLRERDMSLNAMGLEKTQLEEELRIARKRNDELSSGLKKQVDLVQASNSKLQAAISEIESARLQNAMLATSVGQLTMSVRGREKEVKELRADLDHRDEIVRRFKSHRTVRVLEKLRLMALEYPETMRDE